MNTRTQTDIWIYRIAIVLGSIIVAGFIGTLTLMTMAWPMLQVLVVFGVVAVAGLVRLLISPLNRELLD